MCHKRRIRCAGNRQSETVQSFLFGIGGDMSFHLRLFRGILYVPYVMFWWPVWHETNHISFAHQMAAWNGSSKITNRMQAYIWRYWFLLHVIFALSKQWIVNHWIGTHCGCILGHGDISMELLVMSSREIKQRHGADDHLVQLLWPTLNKNQYDLPDELATYRYKRVRVTDHFHPL